MISRASANLVRAVGPADLVRVESLAQAFDVPVESAYCEGCGHGTFFTNSAQRDDELKRIIEFLRRHLGR